MLKIVKLKSGHNMYAVCYKTGVWSLVTTNMYALHNLSLVIICCRLHNIVLSRTLTGK